MNWISVISNIVIMTAWSTVITIASVMALAVVERKAAVAPVNAISHIVFGESAYDSRKGDALHFVIGFVLNVMAMVGWSAVAELAFRGLHLPVNQFSSALVVAIGVTVLAYFTDFHLVPKRFTPGFEHILSRRALLMTYVFLALSFVIGGMQRVL